MIMQFHPLFRLIVAASFLVPLSAVGQSPRWTFHVEDLAPVEPYANGANAAKWMETLQFLPLDNDPEACTFAPLEGRYYQHAFEGLDPFLLRWPGGGDQSQFMHFSRGLPGFGYDLSLGGELFNYMIKKDPLEWSRRRQAQEALPSQCGFLDQFIELAKLTPSKDMTYTANVITSDPYEQFKTLETILKAGITVRGIEMGNELYAFRVWDFDLFDLKYWYNAADGGKAAGEYVRSLLEPHHYCIDGHCFEMSYVSMIDSLEKQFHIDLKMGLTAAPPYLGNENVYVDSMTQERFVAWNDTLSLYREAEWLDAYIVHLYARQLRLPCIDALESIEEDSSYTGGELLEVFDCLNESIKGYYGPERKYPGGDNIRRHIKGVVGLFASRTPARENELWVTEWSWSSNPRFDATLMSNTFLDAVFMQRWLHEMLELNTAMVKNPLGLRVTMLNRQLLTGTTENSMIAKRTELDRSYEPDPSEPPSSLWGLGATKAPSFMRRITFWPMQQFADLNRLEDIRFVDVEGADTTGEMFVYAYASKGIDSGTTRLDIYYSWSDSVPYLMDLSAHGIVQTADGTKRLLSDRVVGSWELEYAQGIRRTSSTGWNKFAEISSIAAPPGIIPRYEYPYLSSRTRDQDTIKLAPYSFGRLTFHVLDPVDTSSRRLGLSPYQWQAFPNPAGSRLTLRVLGPAGTAPAQSPTANTSADPAKATGEGIAVRLFDASGRMVRFARLPGQGLHQMRMDGLPSGVYTLRADNGQLPPLRIVHWEE